MTLTLERKIEICNAINTAIAKKFTVKMNNKVIDGMLMLGGKLVALSERTDKPGYLMRYGVDDESIKRIVSVKSVDVELDVIYESVPPPIANLSAESNPGLSNPSP